MRFAVDFSRGGFNTSTQREQVYLGIRKLQSFIHSLARRACISGFKTGSNREFLRTEKFGPLACSASFAPLCEISFSMSPILAARSFLKN